MAPILVYRASDLFPGGTAETDACGLRVVYSHPLAASLARGSSGGAPASCVGGRGPQKKKKKKKTAGEAGRWEMADAEAEKARLERVASLGEGGDPEPEAPLEIVRLAPPQSHRSAVNRR